MEHCNRSSVIIYLNDTVHVNISPNFNPITLTVLTGYCILVASGVVGNALVIKWFLPQRNAAGSKLVIALACTDLFTSILLPFVGIHNTISQALHSEYTWPKWFLGRALCHLMYGLPFVFMSTSAWILVAISVERYR